MLNADSYLHMFLADIPEKQPALLSLVYVAGFALLALLLFASLLFMRRRRRSALEAVAPEDLPPGGRQRLRATSTNRGLRALRRLFVLLPLRGFRFHVFSGAHAAETDRRL